MGSLASLIAALVAAAPGATTTDAAASLTITHRPQGTAQPARTATLECEPTGGTLAKRVEACRRLTQLGRAAFAPIPKDAVCTQIYGGPATAVISGRFAGSRVWVKLARRNGCEIARWNRLAFLLPGATRAASSLRIAVIGDFGVGGASQRALGEAMRAFHARRPLDAVVTTGDNNYASATSFHTNWRTTLGWLRQERVVVSGSLGNHDVERGDPSYQFDALGMPARYYTRRIGDVALFVLDSNEVTAAQTAWLERALAASRAPWKIAVFHHPAHTCGTYRSQTERVDGWLPVLRRGGVNVVLNGHDHNYQRFAGRPAFVVEGGGGANLYALGACSPGAPATKFARSAHGFLVLEFGSDRVSGMRVGFDGEAMDRFTLTR